MCALCGEAAFGGHAVALSERPAHRLHGLVWRGTHEEAASGSLRRLIGMAKAFSDGRAGLWKSPLVVLSWNEASGGLRCLAGVAVGQDEALPDGFCAIDLPPMRFASSWHGPQDGDVVAHYGRMIEWLRDNGWRRDTAIFEQREEYPHDADFDGAVPDRTLALRLLLPVARRVG